jgi:hypothetical protein
MEIGGGMTMTKALKSRSKVIKLDPRRVNDPELLGKWDGIWSRVYELRLAISRAKRLGQTISVRMMEEYEQARNIERQFFWDNFYKQD